MKVTVDIPDREWAIMVTRAEQHGLKIPDLIRAGITSVMPHNRPIGDDVIMLVRAGYPDARIAERLGVVNGTVARIRRRAGLPANRFRRSEGRADVRPFSVPEGA